MHQAHHPRGRSGHLAIVVALVIAVPALYVLSVGPVGMLVEKGHLGQTTAGVLEGLYAPLVWLHEHTPLRRPLDWYARLWGWD